MFVTLHNETTSDPPFKTIWVFLPATVSLIRGLDESAEHAYELSLLVKDFFPRARIILSRKHTERNLRLVFARGWAKLID